MKLADDELDIYKAEWSHCEDGIGRFDNLVFQIRGWATSASGVLLAAAFTLARSELVLISGFIAIMFWAIEAINKTYQGIFIERSHDIQIMLAAHMQNAVTQSMKDGLLIGPQFHRAFAEHKADGIAAILSRAMFSNVALFYVALILACGGSYLVIPAGHGPAKCAVSTTPLTKAR